MLLPPNCSFHTRIQRITEMQLRHINVKWKSNLSVFQAKTYMKIYDFLITVKYIKLEIADDTYFKKVFTIRHLT